VRLKVLLMGPYPPPYGGVSVHVLAAHKLLTEAGLSCQVLNLPEPSRAKGAARLRHWARLIRSLRRRAKQGWIIHVHINGHNWKSWAVAAIGGVSGSAAAGRILTLHSGMVAKYLGTASAWRRALAAFACARFTRIVCVTTEIRAALLSLGVPIERTEVLPAYLGAVPRKQGIEDWLLSWIREHSPVISTALFFRPEYGFRLLVEAVSRLRSRYPRLGCLVMGSGEEQTEAEQSIEKQGLQNAMLLLGDVDHETCLALISASDVFVRPTFEDGDSVSVREALALGVPVVASTAGVRPGEAILFQSGNLEDLLSSFERALAAPPARHGQAPDGTARLIEIYRQVATTGAEYAAA
jgi:glycogen(starch) synthase